MKWLAVAFCAIVGTAATARTGTNYQVTNIGFVTGNALGSAPQEAMVLYLEGVSDALNDLAAASYSEKLEWFGICTRGWTGVQLVESVTKYLEHYPEKKSNGLTTILLFSVASKCGNAPAEWRR
jgi:hypothetical protein